MTKSEIKRLFVQNPVDMARRFEDMERALKVIYTWSSFEGLDVYAVKQLCADALRMDNKP